MPSSDQSTIDHSLFTATFPNQFLCAPKQGEGCGEQRMEETEFRKDIPDSNSTIFSQISTCSAFLPHLSWVTSTYHYPPTQCANTLLAFQLWLTLFLSFECPFESSLLTDKQGTPSGTTGSHGISFLDSNPAWPLLSLTSQHTEDRIRHATNSGSLSCFLPTPSKPRVL